MSYAVQGWLQVITTLETESAAQALAESLVRQRLAACAQVQGPITSHYSWQGTQHRDEEWRVDLKTHGSRWESLVETLKREHPYECPQCVAVSLSPVAEDYASWMAEQLGMAGDNASE